MTTQQTKDRKMPFYRKALVTGASSGIGEALAFLLADKGIDLIVTGRDENKLRILTEKLQSKIHIDVLPLDLNVASERSKLIDKIHLEKPDLIVNNAGFGLYGEALTHETAAQMEIVNVNVQALLEITLEGARTMLSSKQSGIILNLSSAASFQVFPDFAVYAASKAFVTQFSQSFDEEMRPYGIRILASCPGYVETNFRIRASEGSPISSLSLKGMPVQFAAEQLWLQIEKKEGVRIFDWKFRLMTKLSHFIPKKLLTKTLRHAIAQRHVKKDILTLKTLN